MEIVRTGDRLAVVKINGRYYVVRIHNGQVYSVVPNDMPDGGGQWVARATEKGVKYVARGRSRSNAMSWFRKIEKGIDY